MINDRILATAGWTAVLQAWAWPLAALIIVLSFLIWVSFSTAALPMLKIVFGRVRRVSAFGVEFDLTPKAALQTQTNVEAGFGELRQRLNREFDAQVNAEQLNNKLLTIVRLAVHPMLTDEARKSFRCTVHVPDVLFEDALLQLLDYQPSGGGRSRARVFSPIRHHREMLEVGRTRHPVRCGHARDGTDQGMGDDDGGSYGRGTRAQLVRGRAVVRRS